MGITPAGQSLIMFREVTKGERQLIKEIPGVSHHKFSSELGSGTNYRDITLVAL